ncbi:MAG: RAD55 family ATPase [Candidatus ainarchaeum sp.]|nr:RAD55 family ATPase [Candidatus ainarchaeum sp.]
MNTEDKLPIFKSNRFSTGIKNLDILLEGGYHDGHLVMFLGSAGMGKTAFAFHFADAGIKNDELILYVLSDMDHTELLKKGSSLNFDFKKAMSDGKLIFIECHISSSENSLKNSESIKEVISIPGPSYLNDLSLAIKGVLQENQQKRIRVIFHSLSTLVVYNQQESILKFLQIVGGRLKKANITTLFLVEEGMHEKTLISSLQHLMDELFTVHDSGEFSLESPRLPMIIPLKLGSSGIEVR